MHSDMRERERDRDTDTDRQKQTQTERQTDKERENIFFKEILLWTTRPGTERDRQREREYFFQRDPTLDHKARDRERQTKRERIFFSKRSYFGPQGTSQRRFNSLRRLCEYNTNLLSLCREICFLARPLHKTLNTINNKTSTPQCNTELKTAQIQEKYLTITMYTHARTHARSIQNPPIGGVFPRQLKQLNGKIRAFSIF